VYDKVEQLQELVSVADEALDARTGDACISVEQVAQNERLEWAAAKDSAASIDTKAALPAAKLGCYLFRIGFTNSGERPWYAPIESQSRSDGPGGCRCDRLLAAGSSHGTDGDTLHSLQLIGE
jgi:hypothetical protein